MLLPSKCHLGAIYCERKHRLFCIIMDTLGGLLRRTFLDANFIKECFLNLAVWEE